MPLTGPVLLAVHVRRPPPLCSEEQSSKVRAYSIDILSSLVQGGDSLPQEVMDLILSNILEPNKVTC